MATPRRTKAKSDVNEGLLEVAKTLHSSPFSRVYLQASILATDNFDDIAEVFQIPVEVVQLYETTFFPVKGLNRLQKLEMISSISDRDEAEVKRWAVTQGFDFIKWRLGFKVSMSPVESMVSMYSDCYFKSKEAFYTGNSAEGSKEAMKWARLASNIAATLKTWVVDSKEAKKDIELALSKVSLSTDNVPSLNDFEDEEDGV